MRFVVIILVRVVIFNMDVDRKGVLSLARLALVFISTIGEGYPVLPVKESDNYSMRCCGLPHLSCELVQDILVVMSLDFRFNGKAVPREKKAVAV